MISLTCRLQSEDSWADTYGRSVGHFPQVSQKWCHPVRTISHGPLCAVCYTLLHKKTPLQFDNFPDSFWGLSLGTRDEHPKPGGQGQGHLWVSSNAKDTPIAITPEYLSSVQTARNLG